MNTKKYVKLNLSLIPVVIMALIGFGVYFLFFTDQELIDLNTEPEVRRLEGFPNIAYTDKELDKQREVITSEQQLGEFLNYVDESGFLLVKENIDFEKEMLLGVSSGTFDESDHLIKIRKLYEDKENNKLIVSVRESEPGETCEVDQIRNVSVDIVAISKTDMEIEFERVKQVVECDD